MPAYADTIPTVLHQDTNGTDENIFKNKYGKAGKVDIVVSGMSGRFPESGNVAEFSSNLYNGVDMVTENDRRYKPGVFGLPPRSGKLKDLQYFDAAYFGVSPRQADAMDPQLRILLEASYEAIFDAGYRPEELKGKHIGAYVGISDSEVHAYLLKDPEKISGYELTGCCRAMMANRLSFCLDIKGPSFAVDTACSSALVAFQTAWAAIQAGQIEGAIVVGCNLNLKPETALQFHGLGMLAKDGKCKSFDVSGDGYVRSEAIAAVYLQRSETARRIYAHVIQARTNTDGNKGEGITFPSGKVQKELLHEVYQYANIDPLSVSYVEAHGTGTKVGDPQEMNAIADVLCPNRKEPLLVGSVKSNMGHSESASGLCSLIKVLLSIQNKEIPANLHFNSPNPNIPALVDGSLKVVSENTPWNGKYAALNCFGFGGANVHVLLQAPNVENELIHRNLNNFPHEVTNGVPDKLPTLVFGSGRTEAAVEELLKQSLDKDSSSLNYLLSYLNNSSPSSHPYRGYIVKNHKTETPSETMKVNQCSSSSNPVWYIFSGMGSQWKGCGQHLMRIPSFSKAIMKCRLALLPLGVDVLEVITTDELTSTLKSFVAIAAVQVGLVDVLNTLGVNNVEGMIGHSVGELGCGYADGALTAEQSVLSAYWRGRAVEEANLPVGEMAALGLSAEEAEKYLEDTSVVVACHNSTNSVTLSGPKAEVENLVDMFVAKEIFVRRVNSGGVAFHHSSLQRAAPKLLDELQKIILVPKRRSQRWISSSIPEDNWSSKLAQTSSAEYLVNNLVSPVLFSQALTKLPEGAIIIEIAPHSLMQAVLKRAIPSAIQIPLIRKESTDPLMYFIEAFGKLYLAGQKVNLQKLYPDEVLPVPSSTPSIAGMIGWDHSYEYDVPKFSGQAESAEYKLEVDINSAEFSFIEGHSIDGRILFPATGYLVLVWKALAKLCGTEWKNLPITFSHVILHQATVLSSTNSSVIFTVRMLPSKGDFEVLSGENVVVSGTVQIGVKELPETSNLEEILKTICHKNQINQGSDISNLTKKDVYKELKLRGYHYGGLFQGILSSNLEGSSGQLEWQDDWISFLDTMLQFTILGSPARGLYLPTRLRKITIQPEIFLEAVQSLSEKNTATSVDVINCRNLGITSCPGIKIHGLKASLAPRRAIPDEPVLESYEFIPNQISSTLAESEFLSKENAVKVAMDIVLENTYSAMIRIAQFGKHMEAPFESNIEVPKCIVQAFETNPLLGMEFSMYNKELSVEEKEDLINLGVNVFDKIDGIKIDKQDFILLDEVNKDLTNEIKNKAFVLCQSLEVYKQLQLVGFTLILNLEGYNLYLLRKVEPAEENFEILKISSSDKEFKWVDTLKEKMLNKDEKIVWLLSEDGNTTGILGMFKCLKREPSGKKLRCILNGRKTKISPDEFESIAKSDLCVNILTEKSSGTMRHLPLLSLKSELKGHSYLNVLTRGDLSSLTWLRTSVEEVDKDESLICAVHYAPLNFRDIMLATGKLPPDALPGSLASKDCVLGLEFAGVNANNDRVMGLVDAGGLSTAIKSDPYLTWKIPDTWSLKDAATVPVVYSTAYYALVVRANLKEGESVLIHAGSGGVGQAAISIALSYGCKVFTTVGSEKKRQFLKSKFPQLKDENFANSRNGSFEFDILLRTEGNGVDIILNSLSGDLLQASIRCLKEHGRFLEIGKADLSNNTSLGMSVFLKNITFHGILLDALISGPIEERKRLQDLLYCGMHKNVVKPLPSTVYPWEEAEDAFRFMASGKHIGKVLLEIVPENNTHNTTYSIKNERIPSRYQLWPSSLKAYLLTGGLGGLGLEVTNWLINRGAKNIVLTSRSGIKSGYQALCIKRWRRDGVNVRILKKDASTIQNAEALINEASTSGPIGGIFHLAMILEDSLIENQNREKFIKVCKVKADGAVALDIASRKLCPELDHWVTFSSVASGRGNAGQSNYGWANSLTEKIVEKRRNDGLPGLAIQWGGIGDVGVLADTLGNIEVGGTKPQSIRSVLDCLDILVGCGSSVVSSMCIASKKSSQSKHKKSLVAAIANVLGIRDLTKSPMNVSLGDLGLDSLMSVEVKQTLERDVDLILTDEEIRDLTFDKLKQIESGTTTIVEDKNAKINQQEEFNWINYPLIPRDTFTVLKECENPSAIPLFIASPIQGTADPLKEVIEKLDTCVIAMQYTDDVNLDSIVDMAISLSDIINKTQPEGPIHIAGYSFGGSIACEIAKQMEKKGRNPSSLILLDGSQSYAANIIENYKDKFEAATNSSSFGKMTEQMVVLTESEALLVFAIQFCKIDSITVRNELMKLANFEERKQHIAKIIYEFIKNKSSEKNPNINVTDIAKSADMFFRRLKAGFYYNANNIEITCPTLLVTASHNQHAKAFGKDYGLSEVVKGSLDITEVEGTHESFISGESASNVASLVNKFLAKYS